MKPEDLAIAEGVSLHPRCLYKQQRRQATSLCPAEITPRKDESYTAPSLFMPVLSRKSARRADLKR